MSLLSGCGQSIGDSGTKGIIERFTDGWYTDCLLPERLPNGPVGLGFPIRPNRLPTSGDVKAVVLFVDFPDVAATESPAQAFAFSAPTQQFLSAMSYQRVKLRLQPQLTWLRMGRPSSEYRLTNHEATRAFIQEAIKLAGKEISYDGIKAIYVIAPAHTPNLSSPSFTAGTDGLDANGTIIMDGGVSGGMPDAARPGWLPHEIGHNFGLPDLYDHDTRRGNNFTQGFGVMAAGPYAPEMFAYERWRSNWLSDEQIVCVRRGSKTLLLTPIAQSGGIKAAMIRTGRNTALLVESRRASGYDTRLLQQGALVYTVNSSVLSGHGPLKVISGPTSIPLSTGESVRVNNTSIKVLSSTAVGDTVEISVDR